MVAALCFLTLLNPNLVQQTSGDVQVGKSTLHYVVEGQGAPCLVIGSSIYYPRTFSKNLRQHLKLIFVDMPWFAPKTSIKDPSEYSMDSLVGDIDTIRQKLKLGRPILVGHSIHGSIAYEYTKRHPYNVSRLVMIGAPVLITGDRYEASAAAAWKTASKDRQKLQGEIWRKLPDFSKHPELQPDVENYLAMAPKYWYNPRYDARWIWAGMTINADLLHHLYSNIFKNYDMFAKSRAVPVPTFVATGRYDYVIPCEQWLTHRTIPNLTVSLFEYSGHTPQLEEPKLFDGRLLQWLETSNAP